MAPRAPHGDLHFGDAFGIGRLQALRARGRPRSAAEWFLEVASPRFELRFDANMSIVVASDLPDPRNRDAYIDALEDLLVDVHVAMEARCSRSSPTVATWRSCSSA